MYQRLVISCFRGGNPLTSATDAQHERDPVAQDLIGQKKENRGEGHHYENHDGGDDGFAPRGPRHLGGFGPHLLYELKRIGFRHDLYQSPLELAKAVPETAPDPPPALAGVEGLEPPTPGFGDRCSTS